MKKTGDLQYFAENAAVPFRERVVSNPSLRQQTPRASRQEHHLAATCLFKNEMPVLEDKRANVLLCPIGQWLQV
ncbi:hypothetical protein NPIL_118061 [Nephila pilipes]|uniref:Uncharacterized protein n=1 Tax=Nephila pilipes TaxID=299642 RepID=A0A8X6MRW0_NEPPI|nr:hypothetical protein NPIL_118061 [Nephila pilipes]